MPVWTQIHHEFTKGIFRSEKHLKRLLGDHYGQEPSFEQTLLEVGHIVWKELEEELDYVANMQRG